jgi:hypothetical protein
MISSSNHQRRWIRTAAVAACLLVVVGGIVIASRPNSSDSELLTAGSDDDAESQVPAAQLEDPPHLLLEADGWQMTRYTETSYVPENEGPSSGTRIFRAGPGLSSPTASVNVFSPGDDVNWSVGTDAEIIEADGRVISMMADETLPAGNAARIDFDSGAVVVLEVLGIDRAAFVALAESITLIDGEFAAPLPGFEEVELPDPFFGTVTRREAEFEGPAGENAEIRTWSGTQADIELQVLRRAREAISARDGLIDSEPVVTAQHTANRFFVVGGIDGHVIEIDLTLPAEAATDAAVDGLLGQMRFVDLATFESAVPAADANAEEVPPETQTTTLDAGGVLLQPVGVDPFEIQISDDWSLDAISYPVFFEDYLFDVFLRAGDQHEQLAGWFCQPQGCNIATDEELESGARRVGWEPWDGAGAQYWTIGTDEWTAVMTGAAPGEISTETDTISQTLTVAFDASAPTTVMSEAAGTIDLDGVLQARLELSRNGEVAVVDVRDRCLDEPWQCVEGLGVFVVQGSEDAVNAVAGSG